MVDKEMGEREITRKNTSINHTHAESEIHVCQAHSTAKIFTRMPMDRFTM